MLMGNESLLQDKIGRETDNLIDDEEESFRHGMGCVIQFYLKAIR